MDHEFVLVDELRVALHHQAPAEVHDGPPRAVLYVHGATFPATLAVFWRFDGVSWADTLAARGFHVFGLDQLGFGASDRYGEGDCPGRACDVARQIGACIDHIRKRLGVARVHLLAHSWGTAAAALYATQSPATVDRLAMFAPITARDGAAGAAPTEASRLITLDAQWDRFTATVPAGEPPVLPRRWFDGWGDAYIATDPDAAGRTPAAVRVPNGPAADMTLAQAGRLPYDPARVESPTLIVRGEWDHWPTDADARWLFTALKRAPLKRDVKISRGTHLMHLETSRFALYREVESFMLGGDTEPPPAP
jgi:pimeloyl-ACP methyl ester carboxylesterase